MDSERHERAGRLFLEAGRLPSGEREAFLREACGQDAELLAEVRSLLGHEDSDVARRIGVAAVEELVRAGGSTPVPAHPESIGGFRILSVLGRGGMGVVYEAEQENPRRTVALKVIRRGLASPGLLRRFERETEVLGRLQHRGIAQIHGAGTDDAGGEPMPWFAMELVRGEDLVAWAERRGLDLRARMALLAQVCDAVQHAHEKGVVHRDLKPGNVLVAQDGQPKVLDFGVARVTDADVQATTLGTGEGEIVGTLAYMSPEQLAGRSSDVDERADVYALGAIAYQLCSDQLPLDVVGRTIPEAVRRVAEDEPTPLGVLDTGLRGDVETIVAKALEKEPARRYPSAAELAADLRRFLAHETIAARPASTFDQLAKFTRRNRALVAGVAVAFVALLVGTIASTALYFEADRQRALEASARQAADEALKAEEAARLEADEALAAKTAALAAEAEAKAALERRAAELERVSDFRAAQFEDVDPPVLGVALRRDLLEETERGLLRAGVDTREVAARISELDALLGATNFTTLGLRTLEHALLERSFEQIRLRFSDQPLVEAKLAHALAVTLKELGLPQSAEAPMRRAHELRESQLGAEHPLALESLRSWTSLLSALGRADEAEPILLDLIDAQDRRVGPGSPEALHARIRLIQVLRALDRHDEALELALETRDLSEATFGTNNRESWTERLVLAAALTESNEDQDRLASMELQREVIAEMEQEGEGNTLRAHTVRENFADLLVAAGRSSEALELLETSLAYFRAQLGDDHPSTEISLTKLGLLHWRVSQHEAAEPYLREAMDISLRVFGPNNSKTLSSINNYALILGELGREAESLPLYAQALEAQRRLDGPNHENVLGLQINLAQAHRRVGQPDEAHELLDDALPRALEHLGQLHPYTSVALSEMAETCDLLGLGAESLDVWTRLIEIDVTRCASQAASPQTLCLAADRLLVVPHAALQDATTAASLLERAIAFEREHAGALLWLLLSRQALAHHQLGDPDAARAAQLEAIELAPEREVAELELTLEEFEQLWAAE